MSDRTGRRATGLAVLRLVPVVYVIALSLQSVGWGQILPSDHIWSSGRAYSTAGVVLGDVDGDADLDLVCGNVRQSTTVYLNEGGIFSTSPGWVSETTDHTRWVTLGDVDGDGDLDLVCGNWDERSTLHLNEGGVFSRSPAWSSDSLGTTSVALGDVDGDGDLDLVCGIDGWSNLLFLNEGGVFSTSPAWSSEPWNYSEAIALGDVDGDGDLDLVCGNYDQSNTLYLNNGSTFSAAPAWSSGRENSTTSVVLGDVDGDGDLDLVCSNNGQSNTLYLNSGGVFTAEPTWSSEPANDTHVVVLGDIDMDGDLDLLCANYAQSNTLYLNSGGTFSANPDWLSGPEDLTLNLAVGDVDGDGDLEVVCANGGYPGRSNTMYLNETAGIGITPAWWSGSPRPTTSVALGDVDGDGDLDLVCGNNGHSNTLYRNQGGVLGANPAWLSGLVRQTRDVALGDVNGDGALDLVCGNWDERVKIYFNQGGVFAKSPGWSSDTPDMTTSVGLSDVDGDGDLDLVCGNGGDPGRSNHLYLNEGGVLSTSPVWSSGPENCTESVALGDVDNDGDPDLVCGNAPGNNTLYLNEDGMFSETPAWLSSTANHTRSINLGDVDGDGDLDIVCGNDNQRNMIYLNHGGVFSTSPDWSSGPPNHTQSITLGDMDGDGDLDLVCANAPGSNTLYLNEKGLSTMPAWSSDPASYTGDVALGDVDGDGDLDVVCGNNANNTLYKGARNPAFRRDPSNPTSQLPNNSAFLRSASAAEKYTNVYEISLTAVDVESDPIWVLAEYQFEGTPIWYQAEIAGRSGKTGPLGTCPEGSVHLLSWDISRLPFDRRSVILRLRTISTPLWVSSVQHIPSYNRMIGPIEPRRPQITSSTALLSFPTLTVGDTASLHIRISNTGNETLTILSVGLPSPEMRCELPVPHSMDPGDSLDMCVFLEPRTETGIYGNLLIGSDDPVNPVDSIKVETDIRALDVDCRLLTSAPEVPLGEALTAIITPAPEVHVEHGFLYHRAYDTESFLDSIPLSKSADDFIVVIPGEGITEAGLEYYVRVENSGVFATDPPGAPYDSVFYQAVASPDAMTVTPHPSSGSDFLEGRDIAVLVSLPKGTEFIEGTLHLRRGGESAYHALALRETEPLPTAHIPDSLVGPKGLEYWVDVRTLTTSLTYPAISPDSCPAVIRVTVVDFSETEVSPADEYRMVTVPLDFGTDFTGTLETLLADQSAFGPYDPFRWRSFRYLPSLGDYAELSEEYGEEFKPVPGRAFWLICSRENWISTAPVRGLSTPTDNLHSMLLEPGWNQVGNPFVFPVAWDSVLIDTLAMAEAESVIVEPAVSWDSGEGYRYGVDILIPFEGYWVKNLSDGPAVMRVPAREAPAETYQADPAGLPIASVAGPASGEGWRIRIRASSGGAVDLGNYLGVRRGASTEWDRNDRSEPPMNPGRAMSLYFPRQSWERNPGCYTCDIRGSFEALDSRQSKSVTAQEGLWGWLWRFDVAKNFAARGVGDDVLLEFSGLESVPEEAGVFLIDRHLGRTVGLRDEGAYSFHSGEKGIVAEDAARFMVLVGSEEFLEKHADELPVLPGRTVLHRSYPNPFSTSAIIRYDLARDDGVSLRIYDGKGALVKVLYDGRRHAGCYEAVWMGENDGGRLVAAGIYFCRLQTREGFTQARKVLLIR